MPSIAQILLMAGKALLPVVVVLSGVATLVFFVLFIMSLLIKRDKTFSYLADIIVSVIIFIATFLLYAYL